MATNQAASSTSKQNQNMMTWYAYGQALHPGMFEDAFQRTVLGHLRETIPNVVPTTYEASEAYLREEFKKPEGERYLRREMCMMIPLRLPKDRKVYLTVPSMKVVMPIHEGAIMAIPTVELPPDSFGSPENMGFLDSKNTDNKLIYDPPTNIPQEGTIVLSYLTKLGPDEPLDNTSVNSIQLDHTPYT